MISVADIMEGARQDFGRKKGRGRKAADGSGSYHAMSREDQLKRADQLEQRMFKHAENLEFEEAARVRDEVQELRRLALELPGSPGSQRRRFTA